MQTIEINLYKFNELNEEVKQKLIDKQRENISTEHIYNDARESVYEFIRRVNIPIETGRNSWLEARFDKVSDEVLILTGNRLRTYLINNMDFLYKRKYIKHFDGHKTHKMIRNKTAERTGKKYCSAYSNIFFEAKNCNLTGICYDESLLKPIYDFIESPNNSETLEDVINECFDTLKKDIESEIEYLESEEALIEDIEENNYDYTENGEEF